MACEQSAPYYANEHGLRYGQFLIGPSQHRLPGDWPQKKLDGRLFLATHPLLSITTSKRHDRSLTLIGFMLDPDRPWTDDGKILGELLEQCDKPKQLLAATSRLGGRWTIIASYGDETIMFHDALGLRQIFYHPPAQDRELWVMSHPAIGADILGLEVDEDAVRFMSSPEFTAHKEYRWPAAATPYREINHLLPNHYLDLRTGTEHRYWPDVALPAYTRDTALDEAAHLLTGMIRAAARRFDLALGITAGLDSRLVLAASREVAAKLDYVSVQQHGMADNHRDIVVPAALLSRLGLRHTVVRAKEMSPRFRDAFMKNVPMAHEVYGHDAEAILERFARQKTVMTGSGAEVGRCSFRRQPVMFGRRRITPATLSKLQKMGSQTFSVFHFSRWLENLPTVEGLHVLDLFEWEQGHGNWLAMTQLEFDIAWREIFTPYNCRALLTMMLGVKEKYRKPPRYRFFFDLIDRLWPEVLGEPINPVRKDLRYARAMLRNRTRALANLYSCLREHTERT